MWDSVKIRKEILKVGRRRSRFLEYAECGHFALLFCKERNYNPRLHSLVLVAVAVQVCLLNSLKPNKRQNNEQPKSTKQAKAQPNKQAAESAENISFR